MDKTKQAMTQSLEYAKNELKRKQESIKWSVNNDMDFSCFEKNMISDLLYMMELKERIRTLELYIKIEG